MAKLNHENIIKILEIGEEPLNYFTMEYIDGYTIKHLIGQNTLDCKNIALIFQKCAEALHLAHENGIIHRDIKPANIMLDTKNQPKIMDFGLAKQVNMQISVNESILGTPAYMSPEQIEGKNIDRRSDIYSLGATLYEILVGKPAFQGESYWSVLSQIMTQQPVPPCKIRQSIPKQLELICLKAMEKKAEDRYQTAENMAKEFHKFQENQYIGQFFTSTITERTKKPEPQQKIFSPEERLDADKKQLYAKLSIHKNQIPKLENVSKKELGKRSKAIYSQVASP
ncbi:MAG: serine/threonine protein kinase [Candidatus Brocadiae bacterium]|nr:serine/threonine protein kinase [Candidatus Brocadiia bacterium]